jgi:hypothetical protein
MKLFNFCYLRDVVTIPLRLLRRRESFATRVGFESGRLGKALHGYQLRLEIQRRPVSAPKEEGLEIGVRGKPEPGL